ncbi:MAG: hypothetical protein JWN61_2971 [Pseudonocardiales bacterium]|nr:hypothetical protein [Jatrophihabitantaceae bacterium]MCW2604836.1 hypothetical protein [Pseudonocardiales bacterium]
MTFDEASDERSTLLAPPNRVVASLQAAELIRLLEDRNGALMFHQSGGCCDGSSPMCYPRGDFIVGDRDILLGELIVDDSHELDAPRVWISSSQFEAWRHTQLVLDVVPGRGGGFSLESPEGVRFLTRGRVFSAEEQAALEAAPPLTGADLENGAVVAPPSWPTIIDAAELADVCAVPLPPA